MDQRLKELVENYNQYQINLDDSFRFHCTQCGKCCINREDILLNPKDIYRLAAFFGSSPKEVIAEYCETYIGETSRFPIVRLVPQGSVKRCPFLKSRKCSVQSAKPTVCAMFPIGRCLKMPTENSQEQTPAIEYIFTRPECGDSSETHTVQSWLDRFGIPADDPFFISWYTTLADLKKIIDSCEKHHSSNTMNLLWSLIFATMYLSYDISIPFESQFHTNRKELLNELSSLLNSPEDPKNG